MHAVLSLLAAVGALVAMEGIAWLSHRHLMHGIGWGWHASHHAPRVGRFEKNDLFAVAFAAVAIVLIWLGTRGWWPLQWVGAGMTAYGLLYALAHDGLVHRRWPIGRVPRRGYLKRLYQAHRLHHASRERDGAVSFGFLLAPSERQLREQLEAVRRQRAAQPGRRQR